MKNEIDRHCYIMLNNDMVSDGILYLDIILISMKLF